MTRSICLGKPIENRERAQLTLPQPLRRCEEEDERAGASAATSRDAGSRWPPRPSNAAPPGGATPRTAYERLSVEIGRRKGLTKAGSKGRFCF